MTSLSERLMRPEVKPRVIEDCCALIEREVGAKRGFGGAAVKAGFAVVTRVKPGFIRDVVTKLLPEFADSLQPFYDQSAAEAGEAAAADAFVRHVSTERTQAAEALLGVTDRKIGDARPSVRRAYEKLRPNARDNVEAALPGLASTIRDHLL
ncbi:hypothetical protein DB30_05160 [Enhygromyxa salina]|uniref:Uncharacterized protein n=1 Tax=Enhygromyxa salina TaxID=215803 RepID=A0A0C1ZXI9_9BACT|nr:hypothetical protein [Enhygromyxa salina]KIG15853.1 hypothetical protein DB30_05160 [Enhygromyxa salina]